MFPRQPAPSPMSAASPNTFHEMQTEKMFMGPRSRSRLPYLRHDKPTCCRQIYWNGRLMKKEEAEVSLMEKPRDVVGGLAVMAIGVGFLMFGRGLEMGTSARMGPGYFPTILSILMIALGAVITLQSLRGELQENGFGSLPWRGLILIIGAPVVFGGTLVGLGLAPAVLMVVLATAWASRYASLRASVPLSVGLAAFCALLFIRLLGLPLPLTGPWLSSDYWSPAVAAEVPAEAL
jgi:hypothetical protein